MKRPGERSWSHRGGLVVRVAGVFDGCLIGRPPRLSWRRHLRPSRARAVAGIEPVIGASASGIPRAEASRDDRLDGAHAHLPADIFSRTVQLGARGEIVESGSSISPPRSPCLASFAGRRPHGLRRGASDCRFECLFNVLRGPETGPFPVRPNRHPRQPRTGRCEETDEAGPRLEWVLVPGVRSGPC